WPHVYGANEIYPQSTPVGEITKEQWKARSTPMVLGYTAHAAPMQWVFGAGSAFPAEYQGDAFVTMRGSWNRVPASGYEIVRVRYQNGQPTKVEPFVTGFLTDGGKTHIARPVGLAMAKDGSLLMADDANGVIYRVAYTGGKAGAVASTPAKAPAGPLEQQTSKGTNVPLALKRPETEAKGQMTVSSPSFAANGMMNERYTEYADGVSPALSWKAVAGAKSYVIIAEDPDAKPALPFVHWVMWNIPANVTSVPEGVQEQARLSDPDGVLQGLTTRGSPGYYGPKPPPGEADRDQVLAAMKGHVLAKGEVVGKYAQKQKPQK
ncbi:MAG: YbhB/YbcL family Raf kinase inhibitor-like protein, partial [Oxalobacteraceae bacterium]